MVADLALAWRTWIGNRTHPNNILYALTVLMGALWTVAELGYQALHSFTLISLSLRLILVFPIFIVFFFYLFSYYFPYKLFPLPRYFIVLLYLTIVLSILSILPNVLVKGEILPENRFTPGNNDIGQIIFSLYILVVVVLAFKNLWYKYKNTHGIWRKRVRQVMIATGVAFIGGIIFALIPTTFSDSYRFEWIGPPFTIFTAGYIWYHIFWKTNRPPKKNSYDPYPY